MEYRNVTKLARIPFLASILLAGLAPLSGVRAHHEAQEIITGDPPEAAASDGSSVSGLEALRQRMVSRRNGPHTHAPMMQRDAQRAASPSSAYDGDDDDEDAAGGLPSRLELVSRGRRLEPDATTDVWALGRFAYTGTFNSPCGGEPGAGVHVWKVRDERDSKLVTVIPSPTGSRSNDVKVARMNSGDILVHSNESCAGGPGGFELYNVDDPHNPVLLASVQTDDVNPFLRDALGFVDFGVHNLWLFTRGDRDYVAAVVESEFGNFQIFDITVPTAPALVGFWGAEELRMVELGLDPATVPDLGAAEFGTILDLDAWLFDGFGASSNRFLHDVTISADGTKAYLSNWDAGLVLLDIADPTDPQLVSVALDPVNGSLDGEVNSHAAWPSEDGTIVVESEEDFSAWEGNIPPSNLTFDSSVPGDPRIPGTAIATTAGDLFEANQTGLTGTVSGSQVAVDGGPVFAAIELATAAGSPTFADTGDLSGEFVFIGRACPGDPVLNAGSFDAGDIAIVRRGACFFEDKNNTAADLGAAAVVIANNQTSTPWGGVRIWDYSDPADPVLASTFDTICSASTEPIAGCDEMGTYSVHNVIVETEDDDDDDRRVKAYISWYWDGVLVLDVTDPYDPIEIARFSRTDAVFEAQNGGHQDFWGIYKIPGRDHVYASDRNGGLYVFEEEERDDDDDDDDDSFEIASGDAD